MQPVQNYTGSIATAPHKVRPLPILQTSELAYLSERIKTITSIASESTVSETGQSNNGRPIEEQLFVALADAKVWTSRIAMHLDRATRDRLFLQLDVLHEADEWDPVDKPVNLHSYQALVRAILYHEINSRPALSLMPNGNLLVLWRDGQDKLTIEFLPGNRTRWLVQINSGDMPESATGHASLERLREVLQPYSADRWFDGS